MIIRKRCCQAEGSERYPPISPIPLCSGVKNQAYVFVSLRTGNKSQSKEFAKRSLGHPLVEARCDAVISYEKQTTKRPHLRVNLVEA